MAISTAMCTSFKVESWQGTHNLGDAATSPTGGNVVKLALIKATPIGTYDATSTNYSDITGNTDEAVDAASPQGYTATGGTLSKNGVTNTSTTAWADFEDLTFTAVDLSADGCMIYNSTASGAAISVHDFAGTKTASGGDFVIQFPAADSTNAILRLA